MQGQSQPHSFEDHMTDELRIALEDFSELSHVTAWCAKECASGGPELGRCARICQDLAEIAALNEMLITRDSMFGPEVADMFMRVASEGLPELRQHQQRHPHILETVATIERTMNSCEAVLQQVGQGRQGSRMDKRQSGGQMGAQQTGGQMRGQQSGNQMDGQQAANQLRGMTEQGQYGQGMSGQPTSSADITGQHY
ncbi:hypothetical protein GS429_02275 [Natronorubrum sp. JWXQ-INN-674]|uniref:Uncharacterized protein n=2 Tax=Natronorubrum halalkaliphilum TaxID=2691917 RepID=A0A6B0VIK2_9EURY|nr:hypothetical protein [Natronorubrum halalkaliphilum]